MNELGDSLSIGTPHSKICAEKLDSMISFAWSKLSTGEKVAAAAAFSEIAQTATRTIPAGSAELAHILNEVGVGLFMVGPSHAHGSVAHLSQALKLFTVLKGADSAECGRVHRQLSAIYASSGMQQRAIDSLRRAAEIFDGLLSANSADDKARGTKVRHQQLMTRMEEFANARAGIHNLPPTMQAPMRRRITATG